MYGRFTPLIPEDMGPLAIHYDYSFPGNLVKVIWVTLFPFCFHSYCLSRVIIVTILGAGTHLPCPLTLAPGSHCTLSPDSSRCLETQPSPPTVKHTLCINPLFPVNGYSAPGGRVIKPMTPIPQAQITTNHK